MSDELLVAEVRQTGDYGVLEDNVYFPTNHLLVRDLLGKLLTQLDAMVLPDRAQRAAKRLTVETVWRWWNLVTDNSVTSGAGCIAPIVCRPCHPSKDDEGDGPASNRWGWASEAEWLAAGQKPDPERAHSISFMFEQKV